MRPENTASLLFQPLRQSGEIKRVCSSSGSQSFLAASLLAPCPPWVQRTVRQSEILTITWPKQLVTLCFACRNDQRHRFFQFHPALMWVKGELTDYFLFKKCTSQFSREGSSLSKDERPCMCDLCLLGEKLSVQFSHSVESDSLRPRESQHAKPPCPSPTPGVHSDSRPSSQWCHPAISSSVVPFSSCPQSLPASESFSMSQLFA